MDGCGDQVGATALKIAYLVSYAILCHRSNFYNDTFYE